MKLEIFPIEVVAQGQNPWMEAARADARAAIRHTLQAQEPFARAVIAARYGIERRPLNVPELAIEFCCSESRVRRTLKATLASLRRQLGDRGIDRTDSA